MCYQWVLAVTLSKLEAHKPSREKLHLIKSIRSSVRTLSSGNVPRPGTRCFNTQDRHNKMIHEIFHINLIAVRAKSRNDVLEKRRKRVHRQRKRINLSLFTAKDKVVQDPWGHKCRTRGPVPFVLECRKKGDRTVNHGEREAIFTTVMPSSPVRAKWISVSKCLVFPTDALFSSSSCVTLTLLVEGTEMSQTCQSQSAPVGCSKGDIRQMTHEHHDQGERRAISAALAQQCAFRYSLQSSHELHA